MVGALDRPPPLTLATPFNKKITHKSLEEKPRPGRGQTELSRSRPLHHKLIFERRFCSPVQTFRHVAHPHLSGRSRRRTRGPPRKQTTSHSKSLRSTEPLPETLPYESTVPDEGGKSWLTVEWVPLEIVRRRQDQNR